MIARAQDDHQTQVRRPGMDIRAAEKGDQKGFHVALGVNLR